MRRNLAATNVLLAMTAAVALSACSSRPYATALPKAVERQLKRQDASAQRAVSLCYSKRINTPQELKDEAKLLCGKRTPVYRGTDTFWTSCSLMQPSRATFMCAPAQGAEAEAR